MPARRLTESQNRTDQRPTGGRKARYWNRTDHVLIEPDISMCNNGRVEFIVPITSPQAQYSQAITYSFVPQKFDISPIFNISHAPFRLIA